MGWKKETANGTCFTYEQFHLANILSWLDQTGLLSTMSITDAAEVRHIIEVCILATDMQVSNRLAQPSLEDITRLSVVVELA